MPASLLTQFVDFKNSVVRENRRGGSRALPKGSEMKKKLLALQALAMAAMVQQANATGVDLSSLTTAVDFSTTSTAVLTVAAALAAVYITVKASKLVIGAVKGL
jgi:hypothetical protein